jgi:PleD family two-component response regulator
VGAKRRRYKALHGWLYGMTVRSTREAREALWPPTFSFVMPAILIVDDYSVARKTVRSLLIWHSLEVCGEAENGKRAIEKVKQLQPDPVLLDINMPVMNGVQAAYEIRQIAPSTKILFFTIHDSRFPGQHGRSTSNC